MRMKMSDHAQQRAAQRGLTIEEIEYVLEFGTKFHRGGAVIYFLRDQDLPPDDRHRSWCHQLQGTAIIMDRERRNILTVWRNRKSGLKNIKRKPDTNTCWNKYQ